MRSAIGVLLVACSAAVTHAPPPSHEQQPPPLPAPVVATPTDDPLPANRTLLVELDGDGYTVSVFQNGMVGWHGVVGVQSIGDRRGRIPDAQVKTLVRVLDDAKFMKLEDPPNHGDCGVASTAITYWRPGSDFSAIIDAHCPPTPALTDLEAKVLAYTGADLWIHGNPPPASGAIPDGDHLLFSFDETECFGQCPVFSFVVFDDGTVLWHGESNVSVTGDRRATLPIDRVQALIDLFASAGWLPPPDAVATHTHKLRCNDTPDTIITYQRGGRHQTDDNAHCDGDWDFDDHVLALAGVATWIHTPIEVLRYEETQRYVVSVNDVGDVAWNGEDGVDAKGDRTAKLTGDQLQALADAFGQARFFEMDEETAHSCTDHRDTKITFTKDNRTHTVTDHHCKRVPALADLEKAILGLLSLDPWIHGH